MIKRASEIEEWPILDSRSLSEGCRVFVSSRLNSVILSRLLSPCPFQ